jgi:hypothetical protein
MVVQSTGDQVIDYALESLKLSRAAASDFDVASQRTKGMFLTFTVALMLTTGLVLSHLAILAKINQGRPQHSDRSAQPPVFVLKGRLHHNADGHDHDLFSIRVQLGPRQSRGIRRWNHSMMASTASPSSTESAAL